MRTIYSLSFQRVGSAQIFLDSYEEAKKAQEYLRDRIKEFKEWVRLLRRHYKKDPPDPKIFTSVIILTLLLRQVLDFKISPRDASEFQAFLNGSLDRELNYTRKLGIKMKPVIVFDSLENLRVDQLFRSDEIKKSPISGILRHDPRGFW